MSIAGYVGVGFGMFSSPASVCTYRPGLRLQIPYASVDRPTLYAQCRRCMHPHAIMQHAVRRKAPPLPLLNTGVLPRSEPRACRLRSAEGHTPLPHRAHYNQAGGRLIPAPSCPRVSPSSSIPLSLHPTFLFLLLPLLVHRLASQLRTTQYTPFPQWPWRRLGPITHCYALPAQCLSCLLQPGASPRKRRQLTTTRARLATNLLTDSVLL